MIKERWTRGGVEPDLGEALSDPIVVSLMEADRITHRDVLAASLCCRARVTEAHAVAARPRGKRLTAAA